MLDTGREGGSVCVCMFVCVYLCVVSRVDEKELLVLRGWIFKDLSEEMTVLEAGKFSEEGQ